VHGDRITNAIDDERREDAMSRKEQDTPEEGDAATPDAPESDPVARYYADKKRRYLRDARKAAEEMTTGTPHDWADAERYGKDDASSEDDDAPDRS
jgi:hypothetical protein